MPYSLENSGIEALGTHTLNIVVKHALYSSSTHVPRCCLFLAPNPICCDFIEGTLGLIDPSEAAIGTFPDIPTKDTLQDNK